MAAPTPKEITLSVLHEVVSDFVDGRRPFDVDAVINELKTEFGEIHDIYAHLIRTNVRNELLRMFEQGHIMGYYITTKFTVDENGQASSVIEFRPAIKEDDVVELCKKPINPTMLKCPIERTLDLEIKALAERYGIAKTDMVRMMLAKSMAIIDGKD
jgi:hypothetical protein